VTSAIEAKKVAIPAKGNAGYHLSVSVLHLMQARLLLLRLVQAQQDYTPDVLELKSKLKQLRRQADLLSGLIETAIPDEHISQWIGPALEELRVAAGVAQ
jgi:hypothetical protein